MSSSLLVVVIVGAMVALVTGWTLAATKPATPASEPHGGTGQGVARLGEVLARLLRWARRHRPRPSAPARFTSPASPASSPPAASLPAARRLELDDGEELDDGVGIPWWRRVRAVIGLGVVVTLLGALLALTLAAAAVAVVVLVDRALG